MRRVRADLAYCRACADTEDLARQMEAVRAAPVAEECIFVDHTTGPINRRQGITALIDAASPGDRITVVTLDRLGCSLRETLSLVRDFSERGVFLRVLDHSLPLDTSIPGPGTDMALALLTRLAHLERTYRPEQAAAARAAKQACTPIRARPVHPAAADRTMGPLVGALPPRLL